MTAVEVGHVVAIAQEVFTALVDGEEGLLVPDVTAGDLDGAVHAWVDIRGGVPLRPVVSVGREGADEIARSLMRLGSGEAVSQEDLVDALGEVANVIGGNVKSLVASPEGLTLPQVSVGGGPAGGVLLWRAPLQWRGHRLAISMWSLERKDVAL